MRPRQIAHEAVVHPTFCSFDSQPVTGFDWTPVRSLGSCHCGRGSRCARRSKSSPPVFSSNSVWMKRYVRSTTLIISRLISSSFKRDTFVQGIAPYGLLTMTSEQSPDADDGEMPA